MNKKSRAINWVSMMGAPIVLIVIACLQIYLTQTQELSRWKGGGFGMFSTLDSPSARFLRIYIITENGEFPVVSPSHLSEMEQRIRAIPTESNVSALSAALARSRWIPSDGKNTLAVDIPSSEVSTHSSSSIDQPQFRAIEKGEISSPDLIVDVQAIRVEVWRYTATSYDNQIVANRLLIQTTFATLETFAE